MNAVERVRKAFSENHSACRIYTDRERSYFDALDDVQEELDKEVSCDWENEIKKLKAKYECQIAELEKSFEDKNKNSNELIRIMSLELAEYKAKWEAVELIFGGK